MFAYSRDTAFHARDLVSSHLFAVVKFSAPDGKARDEDIKTVEYGLFNFNMVGQP